MRKGPIVLEDCNGVLYVHSSYRAQLYSAGAKAVAYLIMKEMMALVVLRPKMTFSTEFITVYTIKGVVQKMLSLFTHLYIILKLYSLKQK